MLPLVASGMVVTFLFVFILNWAEFLLALTLTHPDVTTLTVLLNKFQSASEGRLYGPQAAIGTMITIPVVILGMLIQKHLVQGLQLRHDQEVGGEEVVRTSSLTPGHRTHNGV